MDWFKKHDLKMQKSPVPYWTHAALAFPYRPPRALILKFILYQPELRKSSRKAQMDCASKQKNCYIF